MNQVAEKKNSALATFDMEADAQQGTHARLSKPVGAEQLSLRGSRGTRSSGR